MLSTGVSTQYAINISGRIEGMIANNNARGVQWILTRISTSIFYWSVTGNTMSDMTKAFSDLSYFNFSTYQWNIHRDSVTDASFMTPTTSYIDRDKFRMATSVTAVSASTGSYTVTLPSGVFKEAPVWGRATPINVSPDYIHSYAPSESSATSAKFYIRNVSRFNISALSCQFELSAE